MKIFEFLMQRLRDSYKCILALNTVLYVQVKNATKCDVVLSFLYSVTLSSKHNRFMNHEVKKKAVQQLLSLFSHLGPNKNIKNIVNE